MSQCAFENFDIAIYGQQPPYLISFTYQDRSAAGQFAQDVTLPAWSRFGQGAGLGDGPAGPEIARLGGDLFRSLVRGELRDLWLMAQQDLDRGTVPGLCIRLMLRPPGVAALPWEILHDPDRRRTFAADTRTPLVRVETQQRHLGPARPLAAALPLKMLLVVPEDPTNRIDAAGEEEAIRQALADIPDSRITLVPITGPVDILDLRQTVEQERPDIIHLVTHGAADGLLLWRDGEPAVITPASLRTALGGTESVKLVVLNACRTAQDPAPAPLASLGAQMLQTGVPAVVAMQYDIRDQAAIRFAQLLYASLMNGACAGRIDAAVAYARSGLFTLNSQEISFGTPVLWLNNRDGIIFETGEPILADRPIPGTSTSDASPPDGTAQPTNGTGALPPYTVQPPPGLDVDAMIAWASGLTNQRNPDDFSGDLKLLTIQIQQLLQDLLTRLSQLNALYQRRQQGDYVSTHIRRMEALLQDKQTTIQRLDTLIQEQLDSSD